MHKAGEIIAHTVRETVLPWIVRRLSSIRAVEAVYLYGSRARGDSHSRSDIDLAILCPDATIGDWAEVLVCAEEAPTLLTVTAVRLDTIDPVSRFYQNIHQDKVALYERGAACEGCEEGAREKRVGG